MNQLATGAAPAPGKRATWKVALVILAGMAVVAGGITGIVALATRAIDNATQRPWTVLHDLSVMAQTPGGAEAFYRKHPGLAERYPSAGDFVNASRLWASRLIGLPASAPGIWSVAKDRKQGKFNIDSSNGRTTFSMSGHYDFSVHMVMEGDRLLDLHIN